MADRKFLCAAWLAISIIAIGNLGCGGSTRPKVIPVSGTIKFKGEPVANATVTFLPIGSAPRNPFGTTDSAGAFKLTSYDTNDGAVAGDYAVIIVPGAAADGKKQEERTAQDLINLGPGKGLDAPVQFPSKYADKKSSGLKRSVVAGDTNVFNFDLTE